MRVGVAVSGYHQDITQRLFDGARSVFLDAGGSAANLVRTESPGAFELPVIAAALADRDDIEAIVALGCILRGETNHNEILAHAVAHALIELSLETRKPVTLGVLTCASIEEAAARAGGAKGNKGADAMRAALDASSAIRSVRQRGAGRKAV